VRGPHRPGSGQSGARVFQMGRCVARGADQTVVTATLRATREHFRRVGGLGLLQRVAASLQLPPPAAPARRKPGRPPAPKPQRQTR
jgi:hypothetical protein